MNYKHFSTNVKYYTYEEKIEYYIKDYCIPESQIVYDYPEDYKKPTDEELNKYVDLYHEYFKYMTSDDPDDIEKAKEMEKTLPEIKKYPINIEKTLNNLPRYLATEIMDLAEHELFDETITMVCTKCDYSEEIDFEIVYESWFDGDYPVGYCPRCNKPKLVPIDIYEKIKMKRK